jgi:hypothetical protein
MRRRSNPNPSVRGYLGGALVPPLLLAALTLPVLAEEPFRPNDSGLVLAAGLSKDEQSLKVLRTASAASPKEIEETAKRSLERYRTLGLAGDLARARVALEELHRVAPESDTGRLLNARLLQFDHHFDQSVDLLNEVIISNRDLRHEALLVKAGVLTVQGKFNEARKTCSGLVLSGDELLSYTCVAWPTGMMSNPSPIIEELHRRLNRDPDRRADGVGRWATGILADMLDRSGHRKEAEQQLRLITTPSATELAQLADLLIAEGRNDEVVKLLSEHSGFDTLLLRRVIAGQRLNRKSDQTLDVELNLRMQARERLDGGEGHARELAMYYLDVLSDSRRAWKHARRGLEFQRETIDFRIALRAARATGIPEAEHEVRRLAEATQYFDVEFRR